MKMKPRYFLHPIYVKGSIIVILTLCLSRYGVCAVTWTTMSSTGHSYWLSTTSKSYNEARKYCFREGSTLAIVQTDAERSFIEANFLDNLDKDVWIGANLNEGKWYFIDGTEIKDSSYSTSIWFPGMPDTDYTEMCMVIEKQGLRWEDRNCSWQGYFLCQKFLTTFGCPSNHWFRPTWSSVCYRKYTIPENYDAALSRCHGEGFDILMPTTSDQDIFISWYIENYMNSAVWVGYTDRVEEGTFVWDSGDPSLYTAWSVYEPQSLSSDCVAYSYNSVIEQKYLHPRVWFTRSCLDSYSTLCQSTIYVQEIDSTTEMTSMSLSTVPDTTEAISTQQETTQAKMSTIDDTTTGAPSTQDELTSALVTTTYLSYDLSTDLTSSILSTDAATSIAISTQQETTQTTTSSTDGATTDASTTQHTPTATFSFDSPGCLCSCHAMNISSDEYLQLFYDTVLKTLEVNKSSLSKNVRKRISASDERESSQQIGIVGIVFLVASFSLLFFLDIIQYNITK